MSLLLPIVLKTACPSTHHKLAIDALRFLRTDSADDWRDLFLRFHKPMLAGAKAPDDELHDYRNHVLYVGQRPWGGAAAAARQQFDLLVAALAERRWPEAACAFGLLSHYVSDPLMPLATRQSEAGNLVRPGIEWCVNRSYGRLQAILENDLGGYPAVEPPANADGIESWLMSAAALSAEHHDILIEHFDLSRALVDPDEGLDQESQDALAVCLGLAVVGVARLIDMAIDHAAVEPSRQEISPSGLVASLKAPFRLLSCHAFDQILQRQLEAMHEELELTGRVNEALPAEQREIRRLYAEEVLRVPLEELPAVEGSACGAKYGQGAPPRFRPNRLRTGPAVVRASGDLPPTMKPNERAILSFQPQLCRTSPIEDAPGMTPHLAARLRSVAIDTIGDLMAADPDRLADRLRLRRGGMETVISWQMAAQRACEQATIRSQRDSRPFDYKSTAKRAA